MGQAEPAAGGQLTAIASVRRSPAVEDLRGCTPRNGAVDRAHRPGGAALGVAGATLRGRLAGLPTPMPVNQRGRVSRLTE